MFLDKHSKKLISYLAENPPNIESNHFLSYYPVSSLVKCMVNQEKLFHKDYLLPYLEKLKQDGYILSYSFLDSASVHIEPSVQLEFRNAYRRHLIFHDILIPICVTLVTNIVLYLLKLVFF